MIRLVDLCKVYPARKGTLPHAALKGITLTVGEGEVFGIIGRSGAGKSTLLRTINVLERPTSGLVEVDGIDVLALSKRELPLFRRRVGMVFQHFNLLSSRTVFQNIALPLELAGASRADIKAAVEPLLPLVGLADKRDRYPSELSGGQKQRVGIARALASKPHVLLCDEVTSALDPETTRQILRLLKDINRRLNLTMVVITHEMEVVRLLCDKVAVMDHGEVVESGTTADVFADPRHPVTRLLLAHGHEEEDGNVIPLENGHAFDSRTAAR
ncbi:ATP-binding cassette domain-containing protein [Haematospirillum sp. 15-248]|uniref:methionine ABC transporter ATP-binding protein n=1 Tax=Haematospirillum jordaniae TaxID=1549855 RepID=UPI001432CA06|nr:MULTISPECIES: ATP-binding cassette domain-containing protein [Haematospirillum]NKD54787.1 ATP-binding cassette domain-containing protein [Haematospirillum sp. H4890]NKD74625.1 ATP-binding cassette domain-containing protein [Haematospirillum sp. H4485]NKD82790.1 ATP-binding cassette domain-containing protein [Haematospirillum jordaniae]NKD87489.1 ATP-binding cassette domain-containing protein [Haematospirillum sp. 15-248]